MNEPETDDGVKLAIGSGAGLLNAKRCDGRYCTVPAPKSRYVVSSPCTTESTPATRVTTHRSMTALWMCTVSCIAVSATASAFPVPAA